MGSLATHPDWADVLACPAPGCHAPLTVGDGPAVRCPGCGESYAGDGRILELIPAAWRAQRRAQTWEQLQANGIVSYTQAPDRNLGVGPRPDCLAFARFCQLRGRVLDVGCGPQAWPAYFAEYEPDTRFFGVDPLAADGAGRYPRLRALGEYLPFRDGAFDRVLFSTSLDHMIDPVAALREARRVCRPAGQVLVWSGEKRPGAPRPAESPAWYQGLVVPDGAEDPFHFKRFTEDEVQGLLTAAGLPIVEHAVQTVDAWRANHFYRTTRG
jgi:SAM-dependent methyltransferase